MNKEKLPNMPKCVNSFDVFDTLIGRLHADPQSIFELVERNYPFPNFKQLRITAERASNGTLEDIYNQFRSMAKVGAEKAQDIKEFELSTELSQIFPILGNIKKIKNGDILVSDSYYDEVFLRKILNHIGFKKKVHIYITPNGKHTGNIWQKLVQKYHIKEHLGDNPHSDSNMANASGIFSRHFAQSDYSLFETTAIQYDHRPLANLMRVLRLSNPFHPRTSSYKIWAEQAQINVPILILYCLVLNEYCKKHAIKRLLFTSRDCCHLINVFKELFPQYESIYFHASRALYTYPSQEYVAYVKSVYSSHSLIVDMYG
jgi:predicted HAD superfamily hydrolase